jgi:glutamine synthetase
MMETERELYKLGVPVKTRHNEVAPGQYEVAPVFENANVATDHQQLLMIMLKRVAEKYGMVCITHEKPFAGVNGSGKHVNFSFGSASLGNLLEPGDTPHENARFLVFCAAVIRAVDKYAPLLRSVIAHAGNDHRLGANEAPPAIISIFLGEQLTDVFEQIKAGGPKSSKAKSTLNIGVDTLPPLPLHSGDRNRTSPFAFTGNKFEFRAVGSDQSIATPLMALNIIVAESIDFIATRLEAGPAGDASKLDDAIQKVLQEIMVEHGRIIFNGDGYSEAWHEEAEARGLPNLRTAVDAIPEFGSEAAVELFKKYSVLSPREVESRVEVKLEQYAMAIAVEAKLTTKIAKTMIFPAAIRYQSELATTCANLKAVGYTFDTKTLDRVTELVRCLQDSTVELDMALAHEGGSVFEEAEHALKKLIPAMNVVRGYADTLETIVADDLWPLPSYQEMLFIK